MIKIISVINGVFTLKEYDGEITYSPKLKYKINKKYAFDSTTYIKRDPYHEDDVSLSLILSSNQYEELYNILNSPVGNGLSGGIFFVEFLYNGAVRQLQVEVENLPKMSDFQRFGNQEVKIDLVSRYETYTPIDFTSVYGYGNNYGENYGF